MLYSRRRKSYNDAEVKKTDYGDAVTRKNNLAAESLRDGEKEVGIASGIEEVLFAGDENSSL
jgi:hypothetical protein